MSSVVSVEWTCERCKAKIATPHGSQPDGWHCLYAAQPPQSAEHDRQGDLCEDCWDALCEWWRDEADPSVQP